MLDHELRELLEREGVICKRHAFIPKAGCTQTFFDREPFTSNPTIVSSSGYALARTMIDQRIGIDLVLGAGVAQGLLAHATTLHLQTTISQGLRVRSMFADLTEKRLDISDSVREKRVAIVHTVLTTGDSINRLIRAVTQRRGTVACVATMFHRGLRSGFADIPFFKLFPDPLETVPKASCGICRERASIAPPSAVD